MDSAAIKHDLAAFGVYGHHRAGHDKAYVGGGAGANLHLHQVIEDKVTGPRFVHIAPVIQHAARRRVADGEFQPQKAVFQQPVAQPLHACDRFVVDRCHRLPATRGVAVAGMGQ